MVFKLFKNNKNKDKKDDEKSLSKITANEVRVIIVSGVEDTPVQEDSFIAKIIVDRFDGVKYMVNEDKNFKELYPDRDDSYNFNIPGKTINDKKQWLIKEIDILKKKLKDYNKNPSKEYNERDLELKIKIYENRLLELKRGLIDREGSPVYIGDKGLRTFFFYRTSGELMPLRWDLKGSSIYKDIAYKKKQSTVAYQNLLSKYSAKIRRTVEASLVWLLIVCVLWTVALLIGSGYLFTKYKEFGKMYDETKIAELKTQAENSLLFCSNVLQSQLSVVKNLTDLNKKNIELQSKFMINRNTKLRNINSS